MREESFQIEIVLELVAEKRRIMPRIGGKKLYHLLNDDLMKLGYKLGRDGFFKILKEHDLLIKKRKNYTKTTNSFHRFRVYKNLITELEIVRPNQVFVSDITYIRVAFVCTKGYWPGYQHLQHHPSALEPKDDDASCCLFWQESARF